MKTKILIFLILLFANSYSYAALNGSGFDLGNVGNNSSSTSNVNFSENSIGSGLALGTRFVLSEQILTDIFELTSSKDSVFTEGEIFANHNFSGEIKQNYGARLNLGYEINKIRIFLSAGYITSTFDYIENNLAKQSLSKSAPFAGIGLGYDITKNISLRLNSMFYGFTFSPKNSSFNHIEVNVSSINAGLALHF